MPFSEGSWRLELSALRMFGCDTDSEQGLGFFTGSVEYEFPAFKNGKLGLRFYPLVLTSGSKPVHAVGAGIATRAYRNADTYDGLFVEFGASALLPDRDFHENGSRFNFLTEAGPGHKFPGTGLHVTLKIEHISNRGLEDPNSGIDGVGPAGGYALERLVLSMASNTLFASLRGDAVASTRQSPRYCCTTWG